MFVLCIPVSNPFTRNLRYLFNDRKSQSVLISGLATLGKAFEQFLRIEGPLDTEFDISKTSCTQV